MSAERPIDHLNLLLIPVRPERWENTPEAITSIPGVWSNLLSFLGGPHACIGYRFALVECVILRLVRRPSSLTSDDRMKALLFTLIRAFEFELGVPADAIKKRTTIVQRPVVSQDGGEKIHMPLVVKPFVEKQ